MKTQKSDGLSLSRLLNALLVMVFLYLFVIQLWAVWSFTIDDMYITLRYAKNWANGLGLVWNADMPPVEGYSNFSFVVIGRMALFLGLNPVMVLKWLGIVGLFFTCLSIYAISRFWFYTRVALIPCLWLLAYKGQMVWTVSGLETTVYEALISSAVFFIFTGLGYVGYPGVRGKVRLPYFCVAGLLLALAGMTRPEAPVFMGLFVVLLWLEIPPFTKGGRGHFYTTTTHSKRWQSAALFCVTMLICFAPYFFWRWHYYGRLFPNPVYCKGLSDFESYRLDKNYLHLIWPFALLAIPACWHRHDRRHYFLWLPSIVYLVLLLASDPIVAFDNRLFLPALVLLLPLSAKGVAIFLEMYRQKKDVIFDLMMYLIAIILTFLFIPMMSLNGYRHFTENPMAGEQLREEVVYWLTHQIPPHSHVVLADSGFIPYRSPQRFIDSYCLNNAEMTKWPAHLMYRRLCATILKTKPEVIILTALIENGVVMYTPTDACLADKLANHPDYDRKFKIGTGNSHNFYRYEIFVNQQVPH